MFNFAPSDLNKQKFLSSELFLKPAEKEKAVGWIQRCPCTGGQYLSLTERLFLNLMPKHYMKNVTLNQA